MAGATFGDVGESLSMVRAPFGDFGVLFFMTGAVFGDFGVAIFVVGAVFGQISGRESSTLYSTEKCFVVSRNTWEYCIVLSDVCSCGYFVGRRST